MNPETRRIATFHAGIALIGAQLLGSKRLANVSIVKSEHTLGCTQFNGDDDGIETAADLRHQIVAAMAGHIAQSRISGVVSPDTSTIDRVWSLAMKYVSLTGSDPMSDRRRRDAAATLVDDCRRECEQLVGEKRDLIVKLRDALIASGSLSGTEVAALLA